MASAPESPPDGYERPGPATNDLEELRTETDPTRPPLDTILSWWHHVLQDERIREPRALALATQGVDGTPNVRLVMLTDLSDEGITFFTSLTSTKSLELAATPFAALLFPWHDAQRQIRLRGPVEQISQDAAASYFASIPRASQVAATALRQSNPIRTRSEMEARFAEAADSFGDTDPPLPPHFIGYRLCPVEVELWVGLSTGLHDRVRWTSRGPTPNRLSDPNGWEWTRLEP